MRHTSHWLWVTNDQSIRIEAMMASGGMMCGRRCVELTRRHRRDILMGLNPGGPGDFVEFMGRVVGVLESKADTATHSCISAVRWTTARQLAFTQ